MKTTIETYSGQVGKDGRAELVETREIALGDDAVRAIKAAELARTDAGMIRVIDDLVAALLHKQVLAPEDLPQEARDKLVERDAIRSRP